MGGSDPGCAKKGNALIKRTWEGEEDAQAVAFITAQSLVHVPFMTSCHWGLHVCAPPLSSIPNLSRL